MVTARPWASIESPNGMATSTSRSAWATRMVTSRRERPSSIASRLAGVTRMRSMTPARISAMRPKPTNAVVKSARYTSRPGTKTL